MASASAPGKRRQDEDGEATLRGRILDAAFAAFTRSGYAATTTLDIATRARVSKRELYALVGNKQQMLLAAIEARARRLQATADMPQLRDRTALADALSAFGAKLVREVSDPAVVAVFRLAIAEAAQAPEVARTLDSVGRETSRAMLRDIMIQARASALIDGHPAELAEQFAGLLWRDLLIGLLLGVAQRPDERAIQARARAAAAAFLQLHPPPKNAVARRTRR